MIDLAGHPQFRAQQELSLGNLEGARAKRDQPVVACFRSVLVDFGHTRLTNADRTMHQVEIANGQCDFGSLEGSLILHPECRLRGGEFNYLNLRPHAAHGWGPCGCSAHEF